MTRLYSSWLGHVGVERARTRRVGVITAAFLVGLLAAPAASAAISAWPGC